MRFVFYRLTLLFIFLSIIPASWGDPSPSQHSCTIFRGDPSGFGLRTRLCREDLKERPSAGYFHFPTKTSYDYSEGEVIVEVNNEKYRFVGCRPTPNECFYSCTRKGIFYFQDKAYCQYDPHFWLSDLLCFCKI